MTDRHRADLFKRLADALARIDFTDVLVLILVIVLLLYLTDELWMPHLFKTE